MMPTIATLVVATLVVIVLAMRWESARRYYTDKHSALADELVGKEQELQRLRRRLRKQVFYRSILQSRHKSQLTECRKITDGLLETLSTIYRQAGEAVGHNFNRPIEVGDPQDDPIHLEISFCGPKHIAVYAEVRHDAVSTDEVKLTDGGLCLHHGRHAVLLMCYQGVGMANVADVERITNAVRRYNQSYHASKGVEDAGAEQEGQSRDHDRGTGDTTSARTDGPAREARNCRGSQRACPSN